MIIHLQCRRPGFNPWVWKISQRRAWQPTLEFLPGEPPWTEEPGWLWSMGLQRVRHDLATKHQHGSVPGLPRWLVVKNLPLNIGRCKRLGFDSWVTKSPWRRKWQPTPVFLPGECHGQRSLAGCSPYGCPESGTTEATQHARTHARPVPRVLQVFKHSIPRQYREEGTVNCILETRKLSAVTLLQVIPWVTNRTMVRAYLRGLPYPHAFTPVPS